MADLLDDFLDAAAEAARRGGAVLQAWRNRVQVREKAAFDLVTEADLECERAVREFLTRRFPDHAFLGEENGIWSGQSKDASRPLWILDPVDGTTNYASGCPVYAVSLGLLLDGEPAVGVVFDPNLGELFHAARGRGAWLGGRQPRVSAVGDLGQALAGIEFPYPVPSREKTMEGWRYFATRAQALRQTGSTALDLAYVAAGRLDGFWGLLEIHPWDVAAAAVLIREAGGTITNVGRRTFDPFAGNVVASNGRIHPELDACPIRQ